MTWPVAFRGARPTWHGDPEARLAEMKAGFAEACDRRPDEVVETSAMLAGMSIRLQIVGRDFKNALCGAIQHLIVSGGGQRVPDLVISAWDERFTGVTVPADAELPRTTDEGGIILGSAKDRLIGHIRQGVEVWLDRDETRVGGSALDGADIGLQNRGKPFHVPLLVWLADRDLPVLHAALIAHDKAGLLLVGQGGTGKTTAAMACFLDGFDFLGDDYIALEEPAVGTYIGHSLYDSVWLTPDAEVRLPSLAQYTRPSAPTRPLKRLVHAAAIRQKGTTRAALLRGVVCTTLANGPASAISHTTGAKALLAMAPTSTLRLPVSGSRLMDRMARLAENLPCYELRVGSDLSSLPDLLRNLLALRDRT